MGKVEKLWFGAFVLLFTLLMATAASAQIASLYYKEVAKVRVNKPLSAALVYKHEEAEGGVTSTPVDLRSPGAQQAAPLRPSRAVSSYGAGATPVEN